MYVHVTWKGREEVSCIMQHSSWYYYTVTGREVRKLGAASFLLDISSEVGTYQLAKLI